MNDWVGKYPPLIKSTQIEMVKQGPLDIFDV